MRDFPAFLYLFGGAAALLVSAATVPLWRRWANRIGMVDDPGHRKIHSTPIPLAGGWAVLGAILIVLALGIVAVKLGYVTVYGGNDPQELLRYGISKRAGQLVVIVLGALGMALVGMFDDRFELRPAWKFGGQLLIASCVALAGVRITLFVPSLVFSFLVTVLWIVTVTNALNFLDNMNGLCAGLGVIGSAACGWIAAVQGQYLVASLAFVACGALLGFLPYNFPKASAFLGDAGSHLVGYLLAVLAILPHFYSRNAQNKWAVLSPLVILAVPLLDMLWVVALRTKIGQPFWVGDTNHISHRLVRRGFSKASAVVLIWLMAAVSSAVALIVFQTVSF
jgi:UDP-GlcNAc:undecaprenyl-phosphate/decaprenyl-phosphate GlcNAc-1-phosphate transferase